MAQNGVKSCDFWWFWSHFLVFWGVGTRFLSFYTVKMVKNTTLGLQKLVLGGLAGLYYSYLILLGNFL
jgi:hypothetical protein